MVRQDQTSDVQLHIGESRDSPTCNCTSEFASRPGMTIANFNHAPAKNALSALAVASGFSSVRKRPESIGAPETSVAQFLQVSSGVAADLAMPASPHSASTG